ncbi:MAG: hydrogenase formation protein HypD [Candidatus Bathyarchaeota archaeon]|nr:MAG: hydrogenase formation protein HypD [Candidatus Bathyarchaeota archaeon]
MVNFRSPELAKQVAGHLKGIAPKFPVKFCHVCGTHEWTVTHFGLRSVLPEMVEVVAGPGCPVCVLPAAEIDEAVKLALEGVTVATFGDVLRVPGSSLSLAEARSRGGDVRIVYGIHDAVKMAIEEPEREFVFFSIGFETTAPLTASEILKGPPDNLSFLISHRLIPPAMELLLGIGDLHIDGFIAPGHVSTIIGLKSYEIFPSAYNMPVVVAGFEPLDILFAIDMLLQQINNGVAKLENEYNRVVKPEGNEKALRHIQQVFNVVDGRWRGLGRLPLSAFALKSKFEKWDSRKKHKIKVGVGRDILPGCQCHLIMIGKINPIDCPLYMSICTPESPKGPCMVSIEGSCRIWSKHGIDTHKT